jgi:hypothetical protein
MEQISLSDADYAAKKKAPVVPTPTRAGCTSTSCSIGNTDSPCLTPA